MLRYLLKKLGYVKLSEVDLVLDQAGNARPATQLPVYSFMFESGAQPGEQPALAPPCRCAEGSNIVPVPARIHQPPVQYSPALPYQQVAAPRHAPPVHRAPPAPPPSIAPPVHNAYPSMRAPRPKPQPAIGLNYSDGETEMMDRRSSFLRLKPSR